ncbi:DUF6233 domain-containing protein [Streptomyces sp. NPDC004690]
MVKLPPEPPLPPDPPRLRMILAHLERQIAETDVVGMYLRLQRDAVHKELARAEQPPPQRPARPAKGSRFLPSFSPTRARTEYVLQQKPRVDGPEPALVHTAGCTAIEGTTHSIRADEARAALIDPTIEPCQDCRPESVLGMDVA